MIPTLKQTIMQMSLPADVSLGKERRKIPKLCLLWEEVGLCVHNNQDISKKWNVSHFESGRSVLRLMVTKDKAVEYMYKLFQYMPKWTFTEDDFEIWKAEYPKNSQALKDRIDELQREIYNEVSL